MLGESYDARLARALRRALARQARRRCRATPTPGRWTAAAATSSFAFAPNRALLAGDVDLARRVPGAAGAARPAPPARPPPASLAPLPDAPARAWPLRRALAAGVAAGLVLGFVFALRAGAVLAPLTFLVLWRGVSARTLALLAGAVLLVVLPVLHLAVGLPGEGYDTNYAVQRIAEHWLAVGAVCALGGALWLTLSPAPRDDEVLIAEAGAAAPAPVVDGGRLEAALRQRLEHRGAIVGHARPSSPPGRRSPARRVGSANGWRARPPASAARESSSSRKKVSRALAPGAIARRVSAR